MVVHIHFIESNTYDASFQALFEVMGTIPEYRVSKGKGDIGSDGSIDIYITNTISTIPPENKPCIYFMSHNPYVEDIESFVYNKKYTPLQTKCTSIWIQDVYKEYKTYVETIYKLPVYVVPFVYKLRETHACSTRTSNELDIVLYDSNKDFNQSVLKSLYICEELYMKNPKILGTVYLLNMPSNNTAYKMLDCFQIWKDKKLRIFSNINETEILRFFTTTQNHCLFLSNSVVEHVSSFMYDIVNYGYTLLHTQPSFPYGIYYDNNDVALCIEKLVSFKSLGHTVAPAPTDYPQHLTQLKSAILTLIVPNNGIHIHEQHTPNLDDLTKPLVITYDNAPNKNTEFYIQTLKNNNWEFILIGKDEIWKGWRTRMAAYLRILQTLNPNKVVILTDARDVLCCRSSNAFMKAFEYFKCDLIPCMELMCDNQINRPDDYIGDQCYPISNYWKHHNITAPARRYVNNGLVAGKVFKLMEVLEFGIKNNFTDDQKSLGTFINKYPQSIAVDMHAELFHTTCFGAYAGLLDVRKQSEDAPTFAELFGRSAFFLHIPGMGQIRGARVVYNVAKSLLESGISDSLLRHGYPESYTEPEWVPKYVRPPQPQPTLGAYYQCYKNPVSFLRTMESFQKHYPGSTIVVSNDGGDDYEKYCKSIVQNNVHYTYYPKTCPASKQLAYSDIEPLIDFLRRLWESFPKFKETETHIVLLEDDVRILRQHTVPFKHTINGMNKNWELFEAMKKILRSKGYNGHFYLGGCGGCVIDKEFYMRIPFSDVESLLRSVPPIPIYASDVSLVFIALYYGGSIDSYAEFAETFYPNIQTLIDENKVAFLHQYKNDYNSELTDDERKKLFP